MTISTTNITKSYSGNGSTHSFAYDFPIFADADLTVIVRASTGAETTKTLNTHYIVTGAGASSGGNVLFKYNTGTSSDAHYSATDYRPASGETVVIRSELSNTQTLDLVANDPFPASSFETALDRLVRMVQQHDEELNRSIKLSRTNTMTSTEFTTSATDRASKILAFDSSGEISVAQELGTFKGNSATTTTAAFVQRDIVKATTTAQLNNIYICVADSVVGDSLTDTDHFALLVDAVSAATSQTAAASSATAAASSATAAAASASTASTQASNASSSATAAASSATAAASSATAAAASLDAFQDQYLGAASSDPSTDLDGDALTAGDQYFNTSSNVLKVYTGSAWQQVSLVTGIANGNTPVFTSGAADNDFLRIDGTAIEGRSASEVLSDIGAQASLTFGISNTNAVKVDSASVADDEYARFTANGLESRSTSEVLSDIAAAPAAGSSNVVTTGALNSGSITSGFGSIDNGSSAITTTGTVSAGDVAIGDDVTVAGRASGHVTTDNDGSFDLAVGNDFKCTTAGNLTLTFTNAAAGQSGNIMFINGGNHTISAHADVAINADVLTTISASGTYYLAYYCSAASGSNTILVSASAALT